MANVRRLLNAFAQFNLVQPSGGVGDLRQVPLFAVKAANVSVIKSPAEFYSTLKNLAEKSEKRISLSSLYLGTGKLERELVASLAATKSRVSDLDLTVLLDYNRATRETPPPPPMIADKVTGEPLTRSSSSSSSKSLLLPLVKQGAKVNFYLTLNLGGLWKRWIQRTPKWNELSSLHHMKLYIFDDHLVISGANLGDTYFTTRQDRYVLLRDCPALCDYFDELIRTVSRFSMSLQEDGSFRLHPSWRYDPRRGGLWHRRNFRREAVKSIRELNERFSLRGREEADLIADNKVDTVVFPLLQLGTLGVADEEAFTSSLLRSCCAAETSDQQQQYRLHIGTGYFNLTRAYQSTLLGSKWRTATTTTTEKTTPTTTDNKNSATTTTTSIVMASEEANGFHGGAGILRFIPLVYTHYVRSFLQRIQQQQQNPNIALWYYSKPGWSFHAKGIWLFPCSSQSNSSLTVIGSTNFGYRSVRRDNEAAIVLVSRDQGLRRRLEEEHRALLDCSRRVEDPKGDLPVVPLWVATIATLFRSYF